MRIFPVKFTQSHHFLGCGIVLKTACLAILLLSVCSTVFGQSNFGRILGDVRDVSGAVVAGATVTVTDVQRDIKQMLKTDEAGSYVAAELLPGEYQISVEASSFKTTRHSNLQLEVGKDLRVDFALQPGSITDVVTVSSEVPLVDTTSSELGGTIDNQEMNQLPLNGRNYENLLSVRPGVSHYAGGGFNTLSTDGLRAEDNVFIVDGLNNDEPFSGQSIINAPPLFGDTTTTLPIDAIQEFNIVQDPRAEYGWKPGSVVNVGIKSGTNNFHGTGYAFGRESGWDARNYFVTEELPLNYEQFGGTFGGPIKKNKLFFFGGYEGERYTIGSPLVSSIPAAVSLGGDPAISIPDALADLAAHGIAENSLSATLVKLYPTNDGTNPLGPANFSPKLSSTITQDNMISKVDYAMSERHRLSGEYFLGNLNGLANDAATEIAPQWRLALHSRAQVAGGDWVWTINQHWLNQFRFGVSRYYQPTLSADANVPATKYGINSGITNPSYGGMPVILLGGFNGVLGQDFHKLQGPDQVVQFDDSISRTLGNHAIKFGGEVRLNAVTGGAYRRAKGYIRFRSDAAFSGATPLEDFLGGFPSSAQLLQGDPTRHLHNQQYALYLQDDFRIRPRFTLNAGIRYELNTVMKEQHNLLGNFDPNLGLVQVGNQIKSPYNGDHNSFAPRLGFAWDVSGGGKTVVRGGAGLMYETLTYNIFLLFANTVGLNTVPTGAIIDAAGDTAGGTIAVAPVTIPGANLNWTSAGPVFPGTSQPVNCYANPCTILAVDPKLRTPFVTHWNLNVERAVTQSMSLQLAYVGNHGTKLLEVLDINETLPSGVVPYGTKFPYLGPINRIQNGAISNYNGLQATLTQRASHGLSFTAGYTYSHSLDDASGNWGVAPPQDSYNPNAEYASGDFDTRHRLTVTGTYSIPGRDGVAQMAKGWQLSSIVTFATGLPWTVNDTNNDFSGTGEVNNSVYNGERWDFFGNPSDFTSGPTALPYYSPGGTLPAACVDRATAQGSLSTLQAAGCYVVKNSVLLPPVAGTFGSMGRNLFRDSGFRDWDLSLLKTFNFGDRLNAQFRAEFFNVLNHPNFANPYGGQNGFGAGSYNDPSAGGQFGCGCATPDTAAANPVLGSGGNRAMQLGLKLMF